MKKYTLKNNKTKTLGVVLLLMFWYLIYYFVGNSIIIPSPIETVIEIKSIVLGEKFLFIIGSTFARTIIAFIMAVALAGILGILSAVSNIIYNFLIPILKLLKTMPTMAMVILALIWLKNDKAPILMAILAIFPIIYEGVLNNIFNVDKNIINMLNLYNVRIADIIKKIYIPKTISAIKQIFSSTLGLCFKIIIGGEILASPNNSIGSEIQLQKIYLNTAGVFAWIFIIIVLSMIMELIIFYFQKMLIYKLKNRN